MNTKNIRAMVKNRYRLSTKVQMNFELSFQKYLIGKCCFTTNKAYEIRQQKVSPSLKGIIFSDTIPLSWFTSSILIPWEKVVEMTFSDTPLSPIPDEQSHDFEYSTLELSDPQGMAIELPWSEAFTAYVQKNQLFDI